jgi:membrane protease YdiL (CAAX protease family)
MLLAVWLFGIKKYRVPWETVGLRRPLVRNRLGLPAAALVGSLAFGTAYAATVSALGVDALQPEELPADLLGQGVTRVLNTVVILFWGPFTEEIFFRGFLFAALIAPFGAVRAAVISSAVFALAHVSIATMPPIFVTGLLMSWLYLKGRSVWLPFSAHMAQNLIALSVFL